MNAVHPPATEDNETMHTKNDAASADATRYREAGQWLRALRRHWQITEAELAEQAGAASVELIGWVESGEVRLPRAMYAAMARAFCMDAAEFGESCELYYRDAPGMTRSAA